MSFSIRLTDTERALAESYAKLHALSGTGARCIDVRTRVEGSAAHTFAANDPDAKDFDSSCLFIRP